MMSWKMEDQETSKLRPSSKGTFVVFQLLSEVQFWGDPMNCSPPGSSVHGISQARILEWVAISFSRGVFLTQGSNPHLLYQQVDSLPLNYQGSQKQLLVWPKKQQSSSLMNIWNLIKVYDKERSAKRRLLYLIREHSSTFAYSYATSIAHKDSTPSYWCGFLVPKRTPWTCSRKLQQSVLNSFLFLFLEKLLSFKSI